MPLAIKCPACGAGFRVKDEHAGKKMKCPKCAKIVAIPADDDDVIEDVEVVEEPEQPAAPPEPDFAFDEDAPAPKKGKGAPKEPAKPRGKTWGKYMPCPACGGREAKRIKWTWWGLGWGTKLVTHVRCVDCGAAFNGKSGDFNVIPAVLFVSIPVVFVIVGLVTTWVVLVRTNHWRWPPW